MGNKRTRKFRAAESRGSKLEPALVVSINEKDEQSFQHFVFDPKDVASLKAFARETGNVVACAVRQHLERGDYLYTLTLRFGQTWGQNDDTEEKR